MDKHAFQNSKHVTDFTDWLVGRYQSLSIALDVKSSRFVPGGIRADVTGLDAVLSHYRWRTDGASSGTWNATQVRLRTLADQLKQAIADNNEDAVLQACIDILIWGGDRNARNGAQPYLAKLSAKAALVSYLKEARHAFALERAVIDDERPQAQKMNSMLTKVHALASQDGLPIYDSRVAAAIAALVELWRRETGIAHTALPRELAFPATTSDRCVSCLFGDAQDPGVMSYAAKEVGQTAARWSGAKIRLGWLMRAVLEKAGELFIAESEQDRMHAFEASLFMIGYDINCLKGNWPGAGVDQPRLIKLDRARRNRLRGEHTDLPGKRISTLNGASNNIEYKGDVNTGISGVWGQTPFTFDSEFLQDLLAEFSSEADVGLGASVTGDVGADTIGFWMNQHYPAKPRKYASALGAIFVTEGHAERRDDKKGIRLRFL